MLSHPPWGGAYIGELFTAFLLARVTRSRLDRMRGCNGATDKRSDKPSAWLRLPLFIWMVCERRVYPFPNQVLYVNMSKLAKCAIAFYRVRSGKGDRLRSILETHRLLLLSILFKLFPTLLNSNYSFLYLVRNNCTNVSLTVWSLVSAAYWINFSRSCLASSKGSQVASKK